MHSSVSIRRSRTQASQPSAGRNAGVSREKAAWKTNFIEARNTIIGLPEAGPEELTLSGRHARASRVFNDFAEQSHNVTLLPVSDLNFAHHRLGKKDMSHRDACQILRERTLSKNCYARSCILQKSENEITVIHPKESEISYLDNPQVYSRLFPLRKIFCKIQGLKTTFFGGKSPTLTPDYRGQNELHTALHEQGSSHLKTLDMDGEKERSMSRCPSQPAGNADLDKSGHAEIQTPEKGLSYLKNERVVVPWSCERRTAHSRGYTSQNHRTMTVLAPFATGASSPLIRLFFSCILLFSITTAFPKHHSRLKNLSWMPGLEGFHLNLIDSFPGRPNHGQSSVTRATTEEVGGSQQLLSLLNDNDVITNDGGSIQESRADDLLSPMIKELRKCCGNSQKSAFSTSNDLRSKLSETSKSSSPMLRAASPDQLLPKPRELLKKERDEHIQEQVNDDGHTVTNKDDSPSKESTETWVTMSQKLSRKEHSTLQPKNQLKDANSFGFKFPADKAKANRSTPRLQFSLHYNDTSVPSFPKPEPTNRILKRTTRAVFQHIFENFTKADLVTVAGVATDLINWLQSAWTHTDNSLDRSHMHERAQVLGSISGPGNFSSSEQSNFLRRKLFTGKHDEGGLNFTESSYLASNRIVPSWSENEEEYADDRFHKHWHDKEKDLSSWESEAYEEQSSGYDGPASKPILIKHRDLIEGRQLFGLGFFTGTLLNFIRDPIVLFLIFWFNLWISYAGIATFYNGFTFVTNFFSGTMGGTTTVSGGQGTTPASVISGSTAARPTLSNDPPVMFIIDATTRPPPLPLETNYPSPPSVMPDQFGLPSPPSTVTDGTSSETETLDPLGFTGTNRPPITKPPDLASELETTELTLGTDDAFTSVSETSPTEGTTDPTEPTEILTATPTPDGSSTDELGDTSAEIDSDITPSTDSITVTQSSPTVLTSSESETSVTIVPIFVSVDEVATIDALSFYTTRRPAVTKPPDFSISSSSSVNGPGVSSSSSKPGSTTLDISTYYTTERPAVTKPLSLPTLSETKFPFTKDPSVTNSRPGSSTLDHFTFYTTKRPLITKPIALNSKLSTPITERPVTTKPLSGLLGSSTPGQFWSNSKPNLSTTKITKHPIFVTMPPTKESTYRPHTSTKSTPSQTSLTTPDPVAPSASVKPSYFMTPTAPNLSPAKTPGTTKPVTLPPLLLNLTNNLALDLLGLNSSQFTIPFVPSIHFKPEFPYKPFLNQSIILTDSFLQHVNETREKIPTLTTEIIRNLTTLLSHIYNGSSEGVNSSDMPFILQVPPILLNSSEMESSGLHSPTSDPDPNIAVITTQLHTFFGGKKPNVSKDPYVSGIPTATSGIYTPNTPPSSEVSSQSSSPQTEAPIIVLDRCLSSGGSLAQCLELSQLYGKLFEAVMGAKETETSSSVHISGIPINSNSTLIQNLLSNSTYSQPFQSLGGQPSIPNKPGVPGGNLVFEKPSLVSQATSNATNYLPDKPDSIINNVINTQLLPGAHHPYPDAPSGLFAVGHGTFEKSPYKHPHRPQTSGSHPGFVSSSNGMAHESLNIQASLEVSNAGKPNAVSLPTPQGTLLVAPAKNKGPAKPSLSVPLITDHELIPLRPLPEEPLYGTTAGGPGTSDFDYYLTGFVDVPSNSKDPTSEFEASTKPSTTSLEDYYQVYWTGDSSRVTPVVSAAQSDSHSKPRPQNIDTSTLSPQIQALAKKHPHANVIIGPPPKHIFQKTGSKFRLG